jgi:hypothetical protein
MLVNQEIADQVFGRLLHSYRSKKYPYNLPAAVPPQIPENLPKSFKRGSREHAMFLFTLCYWMRGGIESSTATKQLTRLYNADSSIFLPESEPQLVASDLTERFKAVGLGFNAEQTGEIWKENLARIASRWNGDPRNILADVVTYEDACFHGVCHLQSITSVVVSSFAGNAMRRPATRTHSFRSSAERAAGEYSSGAFSIFKMVQKMKHPDASLLRRGL